MISNSLLFVFASLTIFVSCTTGKINEQPIEGMWQGSYISDASGDNFFYCFKIKPGGTIEQINTSGQKIGEGSWKLDENVFCANYCCPDGNAYSVVAPFSGEEKKIFGSWGYDDNATNGGTWEMRKQE